MALFTNKYESLYCHEGRGGNGKSLLMSLLNKAIGDYMMTAESTFMTCVRKDEKNPTLAKAKGKRILVVSEPEESGNGQTVLNNAFVKLVTGKDKIRTRDLFKSTIEYKSQFTTFLLCNDKPKINDMDDAMTRRIRNILFKYQFKSNPDKSNQFEKPINYNLKDEIDKEVYALEFIKILFEKVKENKDTDEIKQPSDALAATKEYINDNNLIEEFIKDNYKHQEGTKTAIKELYELFNKSVDVSQQMKTQTTLIKNLKFNKIETYKSSGIMYMKDYRIMTPKEREENNKEPDNNKQEEKKPKEKVNPFAGMI
jgi:P4 family phage/plasmid primase-like protien